MSGFAGKKVAITGAARGIGRELALAYAARGAHLALADLDAEGLTQASEWIASQAGAQQPLIRELDLRSPDDIVGWFKELDRTWGRLDVLINNAGLGIWKSPLELSVDEWDWVVNTNLRGAFLCSREAARLMQDGGGAIVNIASTRALMSEPGSEAYAASKGGLLALTHAMALSLGASGIRVNAISPGWIETGDYSKLRPEDHAQHPAGRVGRPADLVRACLYLTDAENDFVTGENLVVDGGMTRKMMYAE
ncbi:SDR family oxidoreductase [Paenibacillus athensensis]|uniref:3-ketoacyl-ACP reductase n=1 Tax=Paenibacillus athensensis TaxID=1967502 RepID=A0A4Y8PZ28_9BACL|nr:SDR family oxidoreductase [Paenibacillus athensensis]MCD1261460.1 SDR family oxidoreductase [Paenibacillus athensensis]